MGAELMIIVILAVSGSLAAVATLWTGRSKLGTYEGRHRR
jgi:hypothetical protein